MRKTQLSVTIVSACILIQSASRYKDKIRANKSLQQESSQRSKSTKTISWEFGETWRQRIQEWLLQQVTEESTWYTKERVMACQVRLW